MKIAIFGTGYVGLVTGVCFAEKGNQVTCVDIDNQKITALQQGESSIFEIGLKDLLRKNIKKNTISFTLDAEQTISQNDIIFIAVGTPTKKNYSSDLRFVYEVADKIVQNANHNKIIVTKSTIPVSTTLKIKEHMQQKNSNQNIKFTFVNNPEFLREGDAIKDCMNPDRVIVGIENDFVKPIFKKLYTSFVDENKIIFMDILSSELTKYAANTFLATKISFINQIAQFCESLGANVENIKKGISLDSRIGPYFLNAGLGYGGSCFPKDIQSLLFSAQENNIATPFLEAIENINQNQRERFTEKILNYFNYKLENKKIAIWGLAFKANTDDIRQAPSLDIIRKLQKQGANLFLYDPEAIENTKKVLLEDKKIFYCSSSLESLQKIDALVICTEWDEFKNFDYFVLTKLPCKVIFDGRNILNSKEVIALGLDYFSIGNQPSYSKENG